MDNYKVVVGERVFTLQTHQLLPESNCNWPEFFPFNLMSITWQSKSTMSVCFHEYGKSEWEVLSEVAANMLRLGPVMLYSSELLKEITISVCMEHLALTFRLLFKLCIPACLWFSLWNSCLIISIDALNADKTEELTYVYSRPDNHFPAKFSNRNIPQKLSQFTVKQDFMAVIISSRKTWQVMQFAGPFLSTNLA